MVTNYDTIWKSRFHFSNITNIIFLKVIYEYIEYIHFLEINFNFHYFYPSINLHNMLFYFILR